MPMPMVIKVVGTIDGKIYVIGYINNYSEKKVMVVFNTKTQMWEPKITKLDMELGDLQLDCVVMADKIYMRGSQNSFVFDPKENKWETDEMLNYNKWKSACVVDDVLYYYDCDEYKLKAYDPKERQWEVVKGVERFMHEYNPYWSYTVNYGGRLVVLLRTFYSSCIGGEIWCAEIALERHQREEIWGTLEWRDVVIDESLYFIKPLAVMV